MRQLCSCLILQVFVLQTGFAQLYKGQWLIGGTGAFSYTQTEGEKITTVVLTPGIGYIFFNKFAGGLKLDLSSQTDRHSSTDKYRFNSTTIGPFMRYYFLPAERSLNIFAEGGYGYTFGRYKRFISLPDYTNHFSSYSFKAGPAIFLNEHTALEVTLGYNHSQKGLIDTAITNTVILGLGLQIHFGKRKQSE